MPGMIRKVKNLLRCALFTGLLAAGLWNRTLIAQGQSSETLHITHRLLNVPINRGAEARPFQIALDGRVEREFPLQLADEKIDYWVSIDVSELKGQTVTLSGPVTQAVLKRIYQADEVHDAAQLYKESGRPAFHFTVKSGWNNDANGPIYYNGKYRLFWQSFPYGTKTDFGFMQWDYAVSSDLVHWHEMPTALLPDKLGAVWSGTSLVDHENVAGFGKDALVIFYTAFDRTTHKQVQCIAYSTDGGASFQRYVGNPVLDTGAEVGSKDTRDPKVFWYEPGKHWVMVLFEKDGMSFFRSMDLKKWTRTSHVAGFHECPDLFELPVDGNSEHRKWVLHGASANYMIGSFDGEKFTPETPMLRYAEGKNQHGDDVLYAAESFVNMPDGRRVQMGWGRIDAQDMPFTQMMLFPTEFRLATTSAGVRLLASPVKEIALLHGAQHQWKDVSADAANRQLAAFARKPLHVKFNAQLKEDEPLKITYGDQLLTTIAAKDTRGGQAAVEVLIDRGVAEVFVDGGERYILADLSANTGSHALGLSAGKLKQLDVYEMKSMWEKQ
ncbi:glycoside hydrolase family 32 protein [Terracidiphilus gabretensis]|uniref:glycoside hydrolase family 32 protein n=1 Tax=Terracidiphilus gabretensis TaxID=1577687 RepID=UPI0018D2500C|nr:glycoside hydrolase family 32 protein [Terracidiphilus gabretensis]